MDERDYQDAIRYVRQQDPDWQAHAQFDQGNAHARRGEWTQAIAAFSEALRLSPHLSYAADVHDRMAICHERQDQFELAAAAYTNAIALNASAAYKLKRAKCFQNLKDYERAIADYTDVVGLDPNNWAAFGRCGECQIAIGDLDSAWQNLNETIRLNPGVAAAYFFRAYIWMSRRSLNQALFDANEAIRLNPQFAAAYVRRCEIYMWLEKSIDALANASEAIRLDPKLAAAYAFRAKIQIVAKHWATALSDLEALATLQALSDENIYNTAVCCYYLGNFPRAVNLLEDLLSRSPSAENPQVLILHARVLLRLGEYDHSLADLNKVIQMHLQSGDTPKLSQAYHLRAVVYYVNGELETALADFTEAIRLDPLSANSYDKRANVYRRLERWPEALADYTEAIRLSPEDAGIYAFRAELEKDMGLLDAAFQDLNHVIDVVSDWDLILACAYAIRAECYMAQEAWAAAIADLDRVIENSVDPLALNMARVHRNKARCHEVLGDEESANKANEAADRFNRSWISEVSGYWIADDLSDDPDTDNLNN